MPACRESHSSSMMQANNRAVATRPLLPTNMHAWFYVLVVLAISQGVLRVASTGHNAAPQTKVTANEISDGEPDASDDQLGDSSSRPDPKTLVEIEKNLLSLFGFPNRPKIDRSKVVIPEAMKQLYAQIMGHDLVDSVSVPKEGLNTRNANTVRSFTHEGTYGVCLIGALEKGVI
uniref:TGFb_propeptide domain-containing protein n=1 Tax=Anopheles maculatus TaxID=74869 RepID=A0A182SDJ8_9DIPT